MASNMTNLQAQDRMLLLSYDVTVQKQAFPVFFRFP